MSLKFGIRLIKLYLINIVLGQKIKTYIDSSSKNTYVLEIAISVFLKIFDLSENVRVGLK